jgi:DNA-binding beta-propeller fold protein YncE
MLGGCRIDGVVGRGGMGVVYRARQIDLDRDVAVKVIAPELTEDPKSRARFLREARAAGAVEHRNVIPVHQAGIADGQCYLVMRYVAGHDLGALVERDGPLAPATAAAVTTQLGAALDAIHGAGYVHRDMKPRNVMLDADGHAYLSDFGLAKQAFAPAGPTTSEEWVGTLDYVAPEQIRGDPVGPAADVYALGGVLYFMLTGRVPFERDSQHAKLWAHLHDAPPRPSAARSGLPNGFDAVVVRALAKDPAARQGSAGAVGRAARAAAAGERVDDVADTITAARPRRRGRAPRRAFIAGAALALVAGAAGLAALTLDGDEDRGRRARATQPSPTPKPPSPLKTVKLGFRPRDLAVAGGRVWVICRDEPRVTVLDAGSMKPTRLAPNVGMGASDIARDRLTLWVTSREFNGVVGLDARTGRVIRRVTTGSTPTRVAADRSGLWIAVRGEPGVSATLLRFSRDGATQLDPPLPFDNGIGAVAIGGGYLWVASPEPRRNIARVTPGGDRDPSAWADAPPGGLAFGGGALWLSESDDGVVMRYDLKTKNSPTTSVGRRPMRLVVVGGRRVYVAVNRDHRVRWLDARRGRRMGRLPVPKNPVALAVGAGHVWVTGVGNGTLTRIDL